MANKTLHHAYDRETVKNFVDSFDIVKFLDGLTGKGDLPKFNKIQLAFIASKKRYRFFTGGRRVGKSVSGAAAVLNHVMAPATRGWIVGPNYDLASKEFSYIIRLLIAAHEQYGLPKPGSQDYPVRNNPKAGELYLKTPWGSEVVGKSAQHPWSLVGEEVDWILMSEAAMHNQETWERYLRPTLTTREGTAIFPCTPDSGGLWLYEMQVKAEKDKESWDIFKLPMWETEHISKKEIDDLRANLSENAFYEQAGGEWRFYEGRVHKEFQRDIHCIESFEIPKNWVVRAGIDFGANRDATCYMLLAESPQGDFYLAREYYASDRTTGMHVKSIAELERGFDISVRVADYHALGRQLMADWRAHGLHTIPCINDKVTRRDRMSAYLMPREDREPHHVTTGKGVFPRLFVFKDKCPNFIEEMMFHRWKVGTRKQGSHGDTVGEDHAISAAGYVLHYATQKERNRMLRPTNTAPEKAPSAMGWT